MGTGFFRYDYARFIVVVSPQLWNHYYESIQRTAALEKYSGEWEKSHKVNRLYYNAAQDLETWAVDIWGEWAGIVKNLSYQWSKWLRRFDVRGIVWDADEEAVLSLGQHLQRHVTSHNINIYRTKLASKRLGRDRGGIGFAVGSHKSDLRIACYKRAKEPVALEFQMQGAYLQRLVKDVQDTYSAMGGTSDLWDHLRIKVQAAGEARLEKVLEGAGIGSYWPVVGPVAKPELPPLQGFFVAAAPDEEQFPPYHEEY